MGGYATGNYLAADFTRSSPARTLGTPYQPSLTRPVWISNTLRIDNPSSAATITGRIEIRVATANPPLTSRGQCRVSQDTSGLLSGSINVDVDSMNGTWVPAGDWVNLFPVDESGSPTQSIVLTDECIF
jgi:hypothetical protein